MYKLGISTKLLQLPNVNPTPSNLSISQNPVLTANLNLSRCVMTQMIISGRILMSKLPMQDQLSLVVGSLQIPGCNVRRSWVCATQGG